MEARYILVQIAHASPKKNDDGYDAEIQHLISLVFGVSADIRYVSLLVSDRLYAIQRGDIAHSSSDESDKYEELFVNPALLSLATNRGNLDCGGLAWIVVRYGNFQQFVRPIRGGHLSICFELCARPEEDAERIEQLLPNYDLNALVRPACGVSMGFDTKKVDRSRSDGYKFLLSFTWPTEATRL